MIDHAVIQLLDEIDLRIHGLLISNGYLFDVGKIERARLTPFRSGDLPAVNYWPAFDELIEQKYRHEVRTLDLRIEAYTTTRDDPFTDVSYKLGLAVWTAINRSTASPNVADDWSPNLGGLLRRFVVQQLTPVIGEGETPWCGCMLSLAATYKVDSYDQTTLS